MQTPVSCIIVDDDEVDRLTTLSFVRKYSFLKVEGVYASAEAAIEGMKTVHPEVLFLDIDMSGISGLELREKVMHIPGCIFITAYPDYAVESFEKDALDFLVKPIKANRFEKAMKRLEDFLVVRNKAALLDDVLGGDTIVIKEGHEKIKIHLHDVIYLEALKDYTRIVTEAKKYCVLSSLGNLLKENAFQSFVRIHRSYAVQAKYIARITTSYVAVREYELPIGRSYQESLSKILNPYE
ncbi:MAG TPA: LytTR family DNA-binding domain-containing protein [Chryseolinea sp.]|nr:LytTR family DNA-binding domain-containing protein [Chryseolinea sp.]HPH45861.1 LytTR family DNA-binding domain-containing protein [Chryseolinea sp.]HPM28832.1 LytTR family DNA-binding domain-containing protein [Chryseolinea sp.]